MGLGGLGDLALGVLAFDLAVELGSRLLIWVLSFLGGVTWPFTGGCCHLH